MKDLTFSEGLALLVLQKFPVYSGDSRMVRWAKGKLQPVVDTLVSETIESSIEAIKQHPEYVRGSEWDITVGIKISNGIISTEPYCESGGLVKMSQLQVKMGKLFSHFPTTLTHFKEEDDA